jgi:hypothetical protein
MTLASWAMPDQQAARIKALQNLVSPSRLEIKAGKFRSPTVSDGRPRKRDRGAPLWLLVSESSETVPAFHETRPVQLTLGKGKPTCRVSLASSKTDSSA